MMRLRGPSGLGDSMYLRPIAEEFARAGKKLVVLSNYPEVFIGSGLKIEPFEKLTATLAAHYAGGKARRNTNQFQDMLLSVGLSPDIPLKFGWVVQNSALIEDVRQQAAGRRIVLVHGGREPMNRDDGYGTELLPKPEAFLAALDMDSSSCFFVNIGSRSKTLYELPSHLDLRDRTSVADLIDLGSACDGVIAQCSFAVPLAEIFDKPLLIIWAARGLKSHKPYIAAVTPEKVFTADHSLAVFDNESEERIREVAHAFCRP